MTQPEPTLWTLLTQYGNAWNAHDLDAILALHTQHSVFHLHAGEPPAEGLDAVRAAFAASLAQWPDIHFEAQDVHAGDQHATVRWTVTASLAAPLLTAGSTAQPTGRPIRFDAVDVLVWSDARIARKDTYVDAITLQGQLLAPVNG